MEIYKQPLSYRIFMFFAYFILSLLSIAAFLPLIISFMVSITSEKEIVLNGYSLFPQKFSTLAYQIVFAANWLFDSYKVTIIVTVVGTFLTVLLTALIGYAISRQNVKYRNAIAMFLFIPMIISPGLIPWYLWLTAGLHLKNTLLAMIFPSMINPFWIFIARNFFKTIPSSLYESAEIDGAGPFYTFFKIVIPLSTPILAIISLFAALEYWNSFINAIWLIDKQELFPLQYMLYRVQTLIAYKTTMNGAVGGAMKPTEGLQMATFILTLGPIVFVYPFIQKYFIKGIMIGAVKG